MNKEYLTEKSSVETLNVVGGKVNSVRFKDESMATARVYENGNIGVAGKLGSCDKDELFKAAESKLIKQGVPYKYAPCKPLKKCVTRRKAADFDKLPKCGKALAKKVAAACPGFVVGGKIEYGEYSNTYEGDDGRKLSYDGSVFSVELQFKDKQSSNIMDAYYSASLPLYGKTAEQDIVADVAAQHDAFFTEKMQLESGEYTVVLDKYDVLRLLIRHFSAENYVGGGSIIGGKLGEKVFSEKLSVAADRNPSTNLGVPFFDAEGTVMPDFRSWLIKDGRVCGLFTNKNTAALYELPQSGCAYASYDGVPGAGMSGLYVKPSEDSLAKLTQGEKAIYISITSGGDMTTDGVVGLPVMLAFLVENGKIAKSVCEFNASGNIFDMLGKDFIGVSSDNVFKANKSGMLVTKMNLLV